MHKDPSHQRTKSEPAAIVWRFMDRNLGVDPTGSGGDLCGDEPIQEIKRLWCLVEPGTLSISGRSRKSGIDAKRARAQQWLIVEFSDS